MPVRAVSAETAGTFSPNLKTLARRSTRTDDALRARSCAEGKAVVQWETMRGKAVCITLFLGATQAGLAA